MICVELLLEVWIEVLCDFQSGEPAVRGATDVPVEVEIFVCSIV